MKTKRNHPKKIKSNLFLLKILLPLFFYLGLFLVYTYPAITHFSTHYFADDFDGLQNIWNMWWVNEALTKLHVLPWYTNYLYFPSGVSLLGHTLNPFNGMVAVPLLTFLSLTQSYNAMVIFSFVATGIFTFYYALYLSKSYLGSLIAGAIFTFSSYHFSHAEAHMQLVSVEWVPLFIYSWHLFLKQHSARRAILSGILLFLILLCDLYYFFYASVIGVIYFLWFLKYRREYFQPDIKRFARSLLIFITVVLCTSGFIIAPFLYVQFKDGFIGAHDPFQFSLDIFSIFIPGGHWKFAEFTKGFWKRLPGNIQETSVSIPLSVLFVLGFLWWKIRKQKKGSEIKLFFYLFISFLILALGPILQINGSSTGIPAPYFILNFIPIFNLSGVPLRMMVIVHFYAAILFSFGFVLLTKGYMRRSAIVTGILSLLLFVELFPRQIPLTQVHIPSYVKFLKDLPTAYSIEDTFASPPKQLYFQTIHHKPISFGYIARLPNSASKKYIHINELLMDEKYKRVLAEDKIGYIVVKRATRLNLKSVYQDRYVTIYTLL